MRESGVLAGLDAQRLPAWLPLAFVLGLTFATYSRTLGFDFIYDDRGLILENPLIHSWKEVPSYFAVHIWSGRFPGSLGNYYRPVLLFWLRLNDQIFGLRPWGWHLATVLVHVLATGLVYVLARRILRDGLAAALAALLFGLHPVHHEAVAWILGGTDALAGMLVLASFVTFLKGRPAGGNAFKWRGLSLVLGALAMLTKETALVLPLLILAYEALEDPASANGKSQELWRVRLRRSLVAAAPFVLLAVAYSGLRYSVLHALAHIQTPLPLSTVLRTWPAIFWFGIQHFIWPVGLNAFYDFPPVARADVVNFFGPLVAVLGVAVGLILLGWRSRAMAFAALWLALFFLPLLDIRVFLAHDFAHDRLLYLPSVGFALVAGWLLRQIDSGRARAFGLPAIPTALGLGLAALLAWGTVIQIAPYSTDVKFFESGAAAAPQNPDPLFDLAIFLQKRGQFAAARGAYSRLLALDPRSGDALYGLGYTSYRLGKLEEAQRFLDQAISVNPNDSREYLYLGLTLLRREQLDEAEAMLRHAVAIRPDDFGGHFALGMVLKLRENYRGALEEFRIATLLNPDLQVARSQIAEVQEALTQEASSGKKDVRVRPTSRLRETPTASKTH